MKNIKHAHRYHLGQYKLEHIFVKKDLGVHVDSDLSFKDHIMENVRKANSKLGVIKRNFNFLSPRLFTTFVRPHLESTNSKKLVIEQVQKKSNETDRRS